MHQFFKLLLNWSEVWPLALALTILFLYKQKEDIKIIFWLLAVSFLIHLLATYISLFNDRVPGFLMNNNIFYNILAFIKPVFTGIYLLRLRQLKQYKFLSYVFIIFILFTIFNFLFLESIYIFSSTMVLAESAFMLIFILTFFLNAIIDDEIPLPIKHPAYFFCTAVGISESINFFIYLY